MAWFINSSALMLVTILLLVVVLKFGRILWHSNAMIILLFMVAFMLSTIMLCFLISVFFSRANLAAACGGIIFFMSYLPYVLVRWFEEYMSTGQKALVVRRTQCYCFLCSNKIGDNDKEEDNGLLFEL